MNIALDAFEANRAFRTGPGTYVFELIRHLARISLPSSFTLLSDKPLRNEIKEFSRIFKIKTRHSFFSNRTFWSQVALSQLMRRERFDLVHFPAHRSSLWFPAKTKKVVTIFDLAYMDFPGYFLTSHRRRLALLTGHSIRTASYLIAISESTKRDIVRHFSVAPDSVEVVHLGCVSAPLLSPEQIQVTGDRLGLPSRYILHVGTLQPRKNLVRLIRVFGRLAQLKGNDDLCLVLAGKKGWMYEGIFKIVKKCSLEKKVIFLDFLDSAGLSAVYCAAEMFVFPSLYEGFGLPVLEAMSYGLPIAASNISSIPEVLGDAGLYFDPYDEEQMYEVILRLLQDKELRGLLGKRAEERAAGFSWTRCAQKTLDLYRRWTGTSL